MQEVGGVDFGGGGGIAFENGKPRIVRPGSLLWLVVGDLSRIRSQIEVLDIAPIEIWNSDGDPVAGG